MGDLRLPAVALAISLIAPHLCLAVYDSAFCDKYTKGLQETKDSPYFLPDYSVEIEKTDVTPGKQGKTIEESRVEYSGTLQQAMVDTVKTDYNEYLYRVDVAKNQCFYDDFTGFCEAITCGRVQRVSDFISVKDKKVQLGSSAESFGWTTKGLKKTVKASDTAIRSIAANRYIMCRYDDDRSQTVVSEFFIMMTSEYSKFNPAHKYILAAKHHKKSSKGIVSHERLDYTSQFALGPRALGKGVQPPANTDCTQIQGPSETTDMPKPADRFSYRAVIVKERLSDNTAYREDDYYHEFNFDAQISRQVKLVALNNGDEEGMVETVADFWNGREYELSLTSGACTVKPKMDIGPVTKMISARQYWGIPSDTHYLRRDVVREIPVDVWSIYYNDGMKDSGLFYLATSDWLKGQNLPSNMFYPLLFEVNQEGKGREANLFYEYKTNPGYHIPDLSPCYQPEDMVHLRLTISRNFDKYVSKNFDYFAMEFRNTIRKVTGIKTTIRIADIRPYEQTDLPDETTVDFTIFGKYVGYNDTDVDRDPVSSQEAAKRIKAQVDKGDFKFTMFGKKLTIRYKPSSFKQLNAREWSSSQVGGARPMRRQSQAAEGGHSGGVMAGVGITLLIVGVFLSLAAIFMYKRHRDGPGTGFSFKMNTLNNEGADA